MLAAILRPIAIGIDGRAAAYEGRKFEVAVAQTEGHRGRCLCTGIAFGRDKVIGANLVVVGNVIGKGGRVGVFTNANVGDFDEATATSFGAVNLVSGNR